MTTQQHTHDTIRATATNEAIALALETVAAALDERGANPHRVQAYLHAADTVRHHDRPLADLYAEGGTAALQTLPGIGDSLASRIGGFIETGQLQLLHRLREETSPEALFMRVPGVGRELARRIHTTLGIETLEDLEVAAHDGRLGTVEGFGAERVRAIQLQLGSLLNRGTRRRIRDARREALHGPAPHRFVPPVETLLGVDDEYRRRSAAGELERLAPRRFNPSGAAWLPVLHTRRGGWAFTALFSNTARAHELGKTDDWVVLYYEGDGREGQVTVVTETRGDLRGRRIVRGREDECRAFYDTLRTLAA